MLLPRNNQNRLFIEPLESTKAAHTRPTAIYTVYFTLTRMVALPFLGQARRLGIEVDFAHSNTFMIYFYFPYPRLHLLIYAQRRSGEYTSR